MTLSAQSRVVAHAGDGVSSAFTYSFLIASDQELTVLRRGTDQTYTALILGTDYTVSGAGSPTGGLVSMIGDPPASGEKVIIAGSTTLSSTLDLEKSGQFPSQSIEASIDKLTRIAQEHDEVLNRALRYPLDETGDSARLPVREARGDGVLGFTADGSGLTVAGSLSTVAQDTSSLATIKDDMTALAAITADVTTVAAQASHVTALGQNISVLTGLEQALAGGAALPVTNTAMNEDSGYEILAKREPDLVLSRFKKGLADMLMAGAGGSARTGIVFFGDSTGKDAAHYAYQREVARAYGCHGVFCAIETGIGYGLGQAAFDLDDFDGTPSGATITSAFNTSPIGESVLLNAAGEKVRFTGHRAVGLKVDKIGIVYSAGPAGGNVLVKYCAPGNGLNPSAHMTLATINCNAVSQEVRADLLYLPSADNWEIWVEYSSGVGNYIGGCLLADSGRNGVILANLSKGGLEMANANTMTPDSVQTYLNLIEPGLIVWTMKDFPTTEAHLQAWHSLWSTHWAGTHGANRASDPDLRGASVGAVTSLEDTNLPDGWASNVQDPFDSFEVVGTGTEYGIAYVDVRVQSASAVDESSVNALLVLGTSFAGRAVTADTRTHGVGVFIRLVAGSTTNLSALRLQSREFDAGASLIATVEGADLKESLSHSRLDAVRHSLSRTVGASAVTQHFSLRFASSASAVDMTLRIGGVHLSDEAATQADPDVLYIAPYTDTSFPTETALRGEADKVIKHALAHGAEYYDPTLKQRVYADALAGNELRDTLHWSEAYERVRGQDTLGRAMGLLPGTLAGGHGYPARFDVLQSDQITLGTRLLSDMHRDIRRAKLEDGGIEIDSGEAGQVLNQNAFPAIGSGDFTFGCFVRLPTGAANCDVIGVRASNVTGNQPGVELHLRTDGLRVQMRNTANDTTWTFDAAYPELWQRAGDIVFLAVRRDTAATHGRSALSLHVDEVILYPSGQSGNEGHDLSSADTLVVGACTANPAVTLEVFGAFYGPSAYADTTLAALAREGRLPGDATCVWPMMEGGGRATGAHPYYGRMNAVDRLRWRVPRTRHGRADLLPFATGLYANDIIVNSHGSARRMMTLPGSGQVQVGDEIHVIGGENGGGWRVQQLAGTQIVSGAGGTIGSDATTVGTAGYLQSAEQYAAIHLRCVKADTVTPSFVWALVSGTGALSWV